MRAPRPSALGWWLLLGGWGAFLAGIFILLGWMMTQRVESAAEALAPAIAQAQPASATVGVLNFATLWPTFTSTPTSPPTITRTPTASSTVTVTPTPRPTKTPRPGLTPIAGLSQAPIRIGRSVKGRPLEVYQFGNGPVTRLIVAGIHGGYEWNTVALVEALILHLNQHPDIVPDDVTLYILRVLNPDGYVRAHDVDGASMRMGWT